MIDAQGRFIIENYERRAPFSSFLPGISGSFGIPIWCNYVNRGQCITSFGIEDKSHSIMEFYPAHQAYQYTKYLGFRTFLKIDGVYEEAFSGEGQESSMHIGMNELVIKNQIKEKNIRTTVRYVTLPAEEIGALVRMVTIKNTANIPQTIEVIDGMPALIPYGVSLESIKEMGQTSKAWMEVLDHEKGVPFFHVRASMGDTAWVTEILGGNFAFGFDEVGDILPVIISSETIFAYDTSLTTPIVFKEGSIEKILEKKQITKNEFPCCFFAKTKTLQPDEELQLYEIYGQAEGKEILNIFYEKAAKEGYFEEKYREAAVLPMQITDKIAVKTGCAEFDHYCRQTYLDNVLRGGCPIILGDNKIFYLYSRKHGDIERDYNFFRMLPEFYSQGNGNYRDINQNRRCDVSFAPYVKDHNIKTFYNCIQINGYNPLGIEKATYYVADGQIESCLKLIEGNKKNTLKVFLQELFTPGSLYKELKNYSFADNRSLPDCFNQILTYASSEDKTDFIEGYWTDHWTYNLDLIQSYLSIYPDKEEDLIFNDNTYTYVTSNAQILPRRKRYVKTEHGIRQYNFLDKSTQNNSRYLTTNHGEIIHSNLFEKLFLLCTVKTAALDCYGMGIEMEGGKPGWYDALNGMPGILGSSMAETYELQRSISFTLALLKKYPKEISLLEELSDLSCELYEIISTDSMKHPINNESISSIVPLWNSINDSKESYWERTKRCVTGKRKVHQAEQLGQILESYRSIVNTGIQKAMTIGNGIAPTYFYYEVLDYTEDADGILPTDLTLCTMPHFLEGSVRYLKLDSGTETKRVLYHRVRSSQLYDTKLNMYKVNTSLAESSIEIGRAKAFTPGWLENESIWLHMEYKYLLELLKSHLYNEYIEDFKNAAIPFQKEEVYGRSLFENVSFIASSANPNPNIHGKGFVARLSGSTVEFIHMWQILMFGESPFYLSQSGVLCLEFKPLFPSYIVGSNKTIEARFLGEIPIIYHLDKKEEAINSYIPGNYSIISYVIHKDGKRITMQGSTIQGSLSEEIRNLRIRMIEVFISLNP